MFSYKFGEFKREQCLVKNLHDRIDHKCDYLLSHSFYLEDGSPDVEYDSSQNYDLHLEHDASPDNNLVDDATLSNIKTDDNYSTLQKQQKLIISLEKLLGEINHL